MFANFYFCSTPSFSGGIVVEWFTAFVATAHSIVESGFLAEAPSRILRPASLDFLPNLH